MSIIWISTADFNIITWSDPIQSSPIQSSVVTPAEDPDLQMQLQEILEVQLENRRNSWKMDADGKYTKCEDGNAEEGRDHRQGVHRNGRKTPGNNTRREKEKTDKIR